MTTATILEEQQNTTEWVRVSDIGIDRTYQRSLALGKVKAISTDFDEAVVGVLIVNVRDNGQIFVMDGQHRLEAMKKRGIERAKCEVHRGYTLEREAEVFIRCNTVRKQPAALDLFRASLVKQDPVAIAINSVVEKCGLSIQVQGSTHAGFRKRPSTCIWAITALTEIYTRGKEQLLENMLTLAARSWPNDGNAFQGDLLLGLTDFHLKYQGRYTREEFITRMNVTDLNTIHRRAQFLAENNGGSMKKTFSRTLQEAYDKGRRTRRLEAKGN